MRGSRDLSRERLTAPANRLNAWQIPAFGEEKAGVPRGGESCIHRETMKPFRLIAR
jgi:hypothetical protein